MRDARATAAPGIAARLAHRRSLWRARRALGPARLEPARISRPVHFYGNPAFPAFKLGGIFVGEGLRRMGVETHTSQHTPPENLHGAILVFVKTRIPKDLAALASRGNRIVIDMRDNFNLPGGALDPGFVGRDVADALIFPNRALRDRFLSIGPASARCEVLYGFADPEIRTWFRRHPTRDGSELRCCYFGQPDHFDESGNGTLPASPPITRIESSPRGFRRQLRSLAGFNLHVDWRPEQDGQQYKPLTKLLIAAECRANIAIIRSPRVLELLPDDYPFAGGPGDLAAILGRAERCFGSPKWQRALAAMQRVRDEHSFECHVARFARLLRRLD